MSTKPSRRLICPLTNNPIRDPVCGDDGILYERRALASWLSTNNISPVTGCLMHASVPTTGEEFRKCGWMDGNTYVHMAGGLPPRSVATLRRGDVLAVPGGTAIVVALVINEYNRGDLLRVGGGLLCTRNLAISDGDGWKPAHRYVKRRAPSLGAPCYNLVLTGYHRVQTTDGFLVLTLGHCLEQVREVSHPFFGRPAVVRWLQTLPEWGSALGHVRLPPWPKIVT